MGCKRFFLKERKNVIFLNKIDVPYCLVAFFVVYPRLKRFRTLYFDSRFPCPAMPEAYLTTETSERL